MIRNNPPLILVRQRGGTFLGFVIGAVFGLALALGVAVYITKVPIPFMNKNQPRPAEGGAAEAQKNKDWDPNAALPGRVPPKPQPGASEATEPVSAGAPAAESRDPLGDLARSRSEAARAPAAAEAAKAPPAAKAGAASNAPTAPAPAPPPAPPPPPAADPLQYFVQAGAFRAVEEAEQMRARLSLMGLQARVSEREQAGRVVYRVRLGPFDRRDDAEKAGERLEAAGITAALVRVQR
jgi:cell division protein FtsN